MTRVILFGSLGVLAFDVCASFASRALGFPYVYATAGSWLIYAIVGYAVGRVDTIPAAAMAGVIVAGVEATVGWWLSRLIGPGRPPSGVLSAPRIVRTVLIVSLAGGFIAGVAAAIGREAM
jgi:hypothetical protein